MGLIAAIVSLVIFSLVISYFSDTAIQNADPYSRYSLVIQVIVATVLALYFWYLQKIDNDKMQAILDQQSEILSKIDKREKASKQYWSGVAYSNLRGILNRHTALRTAYRRFSSKTIQEGELIKAIDDGLSVIESCISNLDFAMSQLSYLMADQSLFDQLTVNNFLHFKELFIRDQIKLSEPEQNIELLDAKIEKIKDYLKRLKAEIPSPAI